MMSIKYAGVIAIVASFSADPAAADIDWAGIALDTFQAVGASPSYIEERSQGYTPKAWYRASVAEVSAAGAAVCAIPAFHMAALAAEFPYYLREVHNSALGMGSIIYGPLQEQDFEVIMTFWANETVPSVSELEYYAEVSAWAAASLGAGALALSFSQLADKFEVAGGVANRSVSERIADGIKDAVRMEITKQILSKAVAEKLGIKAGSKFATKAGVKISQKVAMKYAGKAASGWFPVIGAIACGGANGYIMSTVLDTSEKYYRAKEMAIERIGN